ncbi:restriction endonuclease subunit S [Mycobacterium spongiae]|uniref:Restriction endonuclease subunit S n=1 Tax=Mycobacterium spongiae TaxID=886343 RepID=A0A975JWM7_9MYCO|nr:restriction endonuclease subunit S [Mycobacterium spongiae]QUR67036.1 restriction endonuclease subunit S [Mycobacterium spongiae]
MAKGPFPVFGANGAIGYAATHNVSGPAVVVGRVGSYCGSLRYCDSAAWVTDNALICWAKNVQETRYWYYALHTCGLNDHRAGSGQPLLNQRILRDIRVRAVPARERLRIAEFLGAVDDKIAANQRVIEAAEALMVVSIEPISDHVPLSTLARRTTAFLNPEGFDDTVAHFSLPAFDDGAKPRIVNAESIRSAKFLLTQPCVLVAKLNPRIPRIWNVVRLPAEMALASTEFVALRPIGTDSSALWAAVRHDDVVATLQRHVAGTTGSRQRVHPRDLMNVRVPDVRRLTHAQSRAIASLGSLCDERRTESIRLATFRDGLLPLLMSGTVRVEDGPAKVSHPM